MAAESAPELDIYGQLLDGRIDAVTFTSGSAIRSFLTLFGAEQGADLLSQTVVATIGPVTADTAVRHGITPAVVPATYSIPALVDALVAHFREAATLSGPAQ
jgi:uroporphyrinogen III methyltransferase/synthase